MKGVIATPFLREKGLLLDIKEYLEEKGCEVKDRGVDHISTHCMFCEEETSKAGRLYINVDEYSDKYGLYFCFLCNEKGGLNKLRQYYGDAPLELEQVNIASNPIFEVACKYYEDRLMENPKAYKFLMDDRGFSHDTIKEARFGWADGGLCQYLLQKGYDADDIKSTGLVNQFGEDYFHDEVIIPYLEYGIAIQLRGKKIGGKYRSAQGSKAMLYGTDYILGEDTIAITEGECLPGNAEVLTEEGWVRFDELLDQKIMQVNRDFSGEFVKPLAKIEKDFDGKLVKYTNEQRYYSMTTPGHRMPAWHLTPIKKEVVWEIHTAEEGFNTGNIQRVCYFNGKGVSASNDEIRLLLAVAADFNIRLRGSGERFASAIFTKDRKKKAILEILESLEIEHYSAPQPHDNSKLYVSFTIPKKYSQNDDLYISKTLPWSWISKLSSKQREFILREQALWDGNHVPDRKQLEFSSSNYQEAKWMQTLASTSGYTSTIMRRESDLGIWYKVSILLEKPHTSWQNLKAKREDIDYSGKVFCVQVESGMFLVRQDGCISVTGNCCALHLNQIGIPAVGVPGAQTWKKEWTELLEDVKRVYIVYDADKAGKAGAEKVAKELGVKARIVEIPVAKIDIEDYIVKYNKNYDDIQYLFRKASGGLLVSMREAYDRWTEVEGSGNLAGLKFNVEALDSAVSFGILPGQVVTLLAKTGAGKSLMSINMFQRMKMLQPDIKILYFTLEMTRNEIFERLYRIHQLYYPGTSVIDVLHYWEDNLILVDKNRISEHELADSLEQAAYEFGEESDLFCVDYLGYFARGVTGVSEYDRTTNAIMHVKGIAKDTNSASLVPHQVNRSGTFGEELRADMAKSSGAVEETSDILFTQWAYDQKSEEDGHSQDHKGMVMQKILKSRNGGVNTTIPYIMDPLTLAIVPTSDYEMAGRVKFMRQCAMAGDSWQEAVKRLESGQVNI